MPRSAGTVIENNFSKGLITEASAFNFPENAATETFDCVFEQVGQVRRRLGIDIESDAEVAVYTDPTGVFVEFLWRAVARTGVFTFLVIQIGSSVAFYAINEGAPLSDGIKSFAVDLTAYLAPGAPDPSLEAASFASGNGRLFITHPSCNPVVVEYDEDEDELIKEEIVVKIRDFEGIEDGLEIDEHPETLTNEHLYNLQNQGWGLKDVRMVTPGGGAGPDSTREEP